MKKFMFLWVASLLIWTGCSEEEVLENQATKGGIMATLEQSGSSSRMAVGDGNILSWTEGDAFEIFSEDGSASETWTLVSGANQETAEFRGVLLEGTLKGAAFPASYNPTLSENTLTMTLPDELTYSPGVCNLPMWSSFETLENGIAFNHLCAMLKVNISEIPNGYNSMTVETDQPIAGTFTADLSTSPIQLTAPATGGSNSIKVTFNGITSADDNDRMFYLPLPVNTYSSIKVTISNGTQAEDILLKEWTNRRIFRKNVYIASLSNKESDATTPAGITSELQSVTAATPKVQLTLTEVVDATQGTATAVEVPVVEEKSTEVELIFSQTPTTSEQSPLTIKEAGTATAPSGITNELIISVPENDESSTYLAVETPNSTVTVTTGTYGTITATTAPTTFIVEEGVTVENLIIKAGNVIVRGEITGQITRDESNTDAETFIVVEGEGSVPSGTEDVEGITVVGSTITADTSWYSSEDTELEIGTREALVGFVELINGGTTFEGQTVKMTDDINLFGYTMEASGQAYMNGVEFKGTFDGQNHKIKNMNIKAVLFEGENLRNYICLALIPATYMATVQNVTVEGGKVYVPHLPGSGDEPIYYVVGSLVGFARASSVINCHNIGCEIHSENWGFLGGVVGKMRKENVSGTNYYSHVVACTNSGRIKSETFDDYMLAGGITSGGWGTISYVVGCINTGTVSCANTSSSSWAAGITADFGGENYLYGCFNDASVSGAMYSGDLIGQATYSGYYRYSCYTGDIRFGQDWTGEPNVTEIHQCSYSEAVSILNAGIEAYNALETTTVPCNFRFAEGNTPKLVAAQ